MIRTYLRWLIELTEYRRPILSSKRKGGMD
jgi:hypothetical protein